MPLALDCFYSKQVRKCCCATVVVHIRTLGATIVVTFSSFAYIYICDHQHCSGQPHGFWRLALMTVTVTVGRCSPHHS